MLYYITYFYSKLFAGIARSPAEGRPGLAKLEYLGNKQKK